jgi:4-amino-4-deoxy-L-arabinose transferase-like glycosyltransferase
MRTSLVGLVAAAIFLGTILSPPSLMDDVDSVHAQAARTMLESGDWVTARLNGVVYLDKAPATLWMIAISYAVFGVHDWAARIPFALAAILLCWQTARFGAWAFSAWAGTCAGLCLATCVGLFLFTRVLIPDATLTLTTALAMWSFLRCLEPDEAHPRFWSAALGAAIGAGLLLKGLIAAILPAGAAISYLLLTRGFFARDTWRRLRPFSTLAIALAIASPWYVLATLRNPPYFDFSLTSEPGVYRGFFWRYFINEHLLRYLGLRHPRDYNTVPRLWFWLSHLVWLFPWSGWIPAASRLGFQAVDRAGRTRLLAVCWAGFLLLFFSFSTTQEYYSLPAYPAFALLIGAAVAGAGRWSRWGPKSAALTCVLAFLAAVSILFYVRGMETPGDISAALKHNPEAYTLSLGHMGDLSPASFAYLRAPLALACIAFLIGATSWLARTPARAVLVLSAMMVVLAHAARLAMTVFDPYLSSRPLAEAIKREGCDRLIAGDPYYTFSSVFFYTNRTALIWEGRINNLEYGSYAPGAPPVFIRDEELLRHWRGREKVALLAPGPRLERVRKLLGESSLHLVKESGGKSVFVNRPPQAVGLRKAKIKRQKWRCAFGGLHFLLAGQSG